MHVFGVFLDMKINQESKREAHHDVDLVLCCFNKPSAALKLRGTLAARAPHRPAGMEGRWGLGEGTLLLRFALTVRVLFCLFKQIRRR